MNPQLVRFYFLLAGLLCGVIFLCQKSFAAIESPSLVSLVRGYVQEQSASSSQKILQTILQYPDANLQTVKAAIQDIPIYGTAPVGAQPQRSVKVKGQNASYALYVPPSYTPDQAYPLIVCLHGAGFTGQAYLDRWVPRLENRYILACPTIAMGAWWTRFGEELTLAILKRVSEEYHIDPDRTFLTGMSNGGIGTWIIGMHHADLFAGISPMASGIDDVLFPFVENLMHTPVYVIHGAKDQVMPVHLSQDLVREMKRQGVPHLYREHAWTHPHAGGHFAFTENLIDSRDQYITGRIYAKLHAEIMDPNTIVVNTVRVKEYTLFLNKKLVDFSQPIVVRTNGVTSFEGLVEPNIETLLQEARQRADTNLLFSAKLTINLPSFR
jgi:predicted esterase